MKTKEEILINKGFPLVTFNSQSHYEGIISAMEEYANQFKAPSTQEPLKPFEEISDDFIRKFIQKEHRECEPTESWIEFNVRVYKELLSSISLPAPTEQKDPYGYVYNADFYPAKSISLSEDTKAKSLKVYIHPPSPEQNYVKK